MALRLMLFVGIAVYAVCTAAQSVNVQPSPAYDGQRVAFRAVITSCPFAPIVSGIAVAGQVVTVNYELVRQPVGCFAASAPTVFQGVLGIFPVGTYELKLEGTREGVALPTLTGSFSVVPMPSIPPFERLEFLQGDRRIAIGEPATIDVVVRAMDATGMPVVGAGIVSLLAVYFGMPLKTDEFGFPGFGPSNDVAVLPEAVDPTWVSVTDDDGTARFTVRVFGGGVVIGAGAWPGPGRASEAFVNVVSLITPQAREPAVAVEFHHAALGRYVLVVNDDEVAALDRGAFAGWQRSIGAVAVWRTRESAPPGAVPVCRFFSPVHTSHFLTVDRDECDGLEARWPGIWVLESREAFFVMPPPDPRAPSCPAGTQPLYRMYHAAPGPSHRFVTGRRLRDAMIAAGWIQEGLDGDRSAMCVPQ